MAKMPQAQADDDAEAEKVTPDQLPSTEKVRQGTTGHGVRYVLLFGLLSVIVAFVLAGMLIGWFERGGVSP